MAAAGEVRVDLDSQNPLLINEIAERVLQFVPVAHLKVCRIVCRLWWKESLARYRRTHWLQLSYFDEYAGRKQHPNPINDAEPDEKRLMSFIDIDLYISYLDDPLDPYRLRTYPFQKLRFFKTRVGFDSGEFGSLERLLTQSGHFVKFLALEKFTFETIEDFRRIVFRLSPNLEYLSLSENLYLTERRPPKNRLTKLNLKTLVEKESDVQSHLKYLKLRMVKDDTIPEDALPLNWTQFFAHFPNIENLEFVTLDGDYKSDIDHILKSIHALRTQCGILQQIRGLDILNLEDLTYHRFDHGMMRRLHAISLPLTFLAYDLGYGHMSVKNRKLLLQIGASTLETLVIYKAPFRAPFGSFPYRNRFPNLTKLTLVGPIVRDLQFLKEMSSLKIVRLFHEPDYEYDEAAIQRPKVMKQLQTFWKDKNMYEEERVREVSVIGNTDFSKMSHLTFPSVEEFLVGEERFSTTETMKQLVRLMPNMKRVRIGLENGGFRAVCEHWKGLELLEIIPARLNEEGITGLVPGEETRLPNITDLKYLRAFRMGNGTMNIDSNFFELSDLSLEQGLLQLKCLEKVVVWCSSSKMSEENYQKFKAMFPPHPYSAIFRVEPNRMTSVVVNSSSSVEDSTFDSDSDSL